ncbi:MAG: hypothetical protein KBD63_07895 [Bacteriovoracaceae bacterium]|nr:hypothetical protein [Bacteriovoracaceae bacterium]
MSLQDLHKRYLWIAKNSVEFLKEKGFQKKGMKYFKQKGDFILRIYPFIADAYLNTEYSYIFNMYWHIESLNPDLVQLSIFMGGKKDLKESYLMGSYIKAGVKYGGLELTDADLPDCDQKYVEGIKSEIKTVILPLFDRIHSLDDVICIAEEEAKLEKEKREFFQYGVYDSLARFYIHKGWKDKALEMCDKYIETIPITVRHLAEDDKKKYIKYFDQIKNKK